MIVQSRSLIGKTTSILSIFKSHYITPDIKVKLLFRYVFSDFHYGAAYEHSRAPQRKKFNAFGICLYKTILKITYSAKVTNVEIAKTMNNGLELILKTSELL